MPRVRITISVNDAVIKWIDEMVEDGLFFNRSHGFEQAIKKNMKKE